jgi:hypothetical protein
MPSIAAACSGANAVEPSSRAGSGVGIVAGGAVAARGCGAPNVAVDRASPGFAAGFRTDGAAAAGGVAAFAGACANIIVERDAAAEAVGGGGALCAGVAGAERVAPGNIIVLPATSSEVGGAGAGGERGGRPGVAG